MFRRWVRDRCFAGDYFNMARFQRISDEDLKIKQESLKNNNTTKNEKKAEGIFKEYFIQIGEEDNFYEFSEEKLDKHLAKFWFAERTKDGLKYKVGSLQTIRYSLNRALKSFGHKFDITTRECTAFTSSIKAYEDATKELKQEGKSFTNYLIPSVLAAFLLATRSCVQSRTHLLT